MAVHDWTRMEAGDFHDFHQCWVIAIRNALNSGLLPPGFMAMADQVTGRPIPDVVTLQTRPRTEPRGGGVATALPKPSARVMQKLDRIVYARRKNRVVIRHGRGRVVAVIEIVSPGNKDSQNAIRSFTEKAVDFLNQGVNLLIVDIFPPTPRDPQGIHKVIWDQYAADEPFPFLPTKPFTVASYLAGELPTAYVETVGLGDPLPAMPVFLSDADDDYAACPLEETYQQAWAVFPAPLKELIEPPPANGITTP